MKMIAAAPLSSAPNTGAQNQHQPGAEERRRTAGGRRDRVHRHHLLAGHHVRQRGGKARGDEPGEPVGDQRTEQDGQSLAPDASSAAMPSTRTSLREVGSDQHRPPVPSVEQSARERTEHRVGEVQNGERGGYLPRARGALGAEEESAREPRLKEAVAELARRAQLEQSPEFGQPAHRPPEGHRCVCVNHENSQYKYPGGPRLFATLKVRW